MGLRETLSTTDSSDTSGPGWSKLREILTEVSKQRASQGFSPTETAIFVFSFKQALFDRLRQEYANDPTKFAELAWQATASWSKFRQDVPSGRMNGALNDLWPIGTGPLAGALRRAMPSW